MNKLHSKHCMRIKHMAAKERNSDFEGLAEAEDMKIAERRLSELKEGKVKPLGEKEFREFMGKKGVV